MLSHVAPWLSSAQPSQLPPWNPLRWDGIAQFYPWRLFAARTVHTGYIPLWNPYQFCGTPFLANSQSAPLYPGNILFYLLPVQRAFGFTAVLHLTLCGWFTWLFLRRIKVSEYSALAGGAIFAFCSWQVSWLQLPTFLATSTWIPLILSGVSTVYDNTCRKQRSIPLLGIAIGMLLLAGHLQIAFYGVLIGSLWAIALLFRAFKSSGFWPAFGPLFGCVASLAIGIGFAAPQLVPSIELSRLSHRQGKPTAEGYADYAAYALPAAGLAQLSLPDLFGGDWDSTNPYWGFYLKVSGDAVQAIRHNSAETAVYVGIVPLFLMLFAIATCRHANRVDWRTVFFALLAVLSLLMALGTPVDALFYYLIPGFSQSGSPARSLVIWSFAAAVLSSIGIDAVLEAPLVRNEAARKRTIGIGVGVLMIFALGISLAARSIQQTLPGFKELNVPLLGEALGRITEDWIRLLVFCAAGAVIISPALREWLLKSARYSAERIRVFLPIGATAAIALDLFVAGVRNNPTAGPESVYPVTPGIAYMLNGIGHERIAPINLHWSLNHAPHAVLPPNAATVYQLRDAQGYDSLLTGAYKHFADNLAIEDPQSAPPGRHDASPLQVGNMVFIQNPNDPGMAFTSAKYALLPPTTDSWAPLQLSVPLAPKATTLDEGMDVFELSGALPRARISGTPGNIRWVQDDATRVVIEATSPIDATLCLNDQLYPGWKALIDGKPAHITRLPEQPLFRSVAIPAGAHTVAFEFQPASFRFGLYLGILSFCLCLGLIVSAVPNRKA